MTTSCWLTPGPPACDRRPVQSALAADPTGVDQLVRTETRLTVVNEQR
jgi:hypothetical protein